MIAWTSVVVVAVMSSGQIQVTGISHLASVIYESWTLYLESLT